MIKRTMEKEKYLIVVDTGKPYDKEVYSLLELKEYLRQLYLLSTSGDYPYFDILVFRGEKDLSNSDFIQEMFNDIQAEEETKKIHLEFENKLLMVQNGN